MMHVGLGRSHPLHVEYVHIGVTLSVVQDVLTEAILSHPRLPARRKIAVVKALGKVIWIQNDLFAKWYVRDGEEFLGDGEEVAAVEKEGWLRGRKVLDEVDGEGEEEEEEEEEVGAGAGAGAKGVCPFTGVEAPMRELKIGDAGPQADGLEK